MKHVLARLTCAASLVVSLAACSGGDNKAEPPSSTGGSSPLTTATSQPATTTPTKPVPTATATGPVALAEHSTYTYGGLKVVVNLPTDMPSASRPSMLVFSDFLQADGRTTAQNKLDPALSSLASANVVKDTQSFTGGESVQGIGTVIYRVSKVQSGTSGLTLVSGCLDQSKLVQVRKDGSHYVDANVRKNSTLTMTANINPSSEGPRVTAYTFAAGSC